jgi:hypothetical protein
MRVTPASILLWKRPLSPTVHGALWKVVDAVGYELKRLGVKFEKRLQADELGVWCAEEAGSPAYTSS